MNKYCTVKSYESVRNHRILGQIFRDIDELVELAGRDFFSRRDLDLPHRDPTEGHFDLSAAIHRRWKLEAGRRGRGHRSRWKQTRPLQPKDVSPVLREHMGIRDGFQLDTRFLFRRWKSGDKPVVEDASVDAKKIKSVTVRLTGIECVDQTNDAGWSVNSDDIALRWMFLDPDGTSSNYPREGLEFLGHFFSGNRQDRQELVHTFPIPDRVQTPLILQSYVQLVELDQGGAEDASTENFRTMVEIATQVAEQILKYYVDPLIQEACKDIGMSVGGTIGGLVSGPGGVVGAAIGYVVGTIAGAIATYFVDKIVETVLGGLVEPLVEAWQDDLFEICPFHILLGRTMFDSPQPPSDEEMEVVGAGGRYRIRCRLEYGMVSVPPPLIESLSIDGASALNLEIQDLYDPAVVKCPEISAIAYAEFPRQRSAAELAHLEAFCKDCRQSYGSPRRGGWEIPSTPQTPPCLNPMSGERCPKGGLPRIAKILNFRDMEVVVKPVPFHGPVAFSACCKIVRPGSAVATRTIQLGGRNRFKLSDFPDLGPFVASDFQDGSALQIEVEVKNALVPESRSRKILLLTPNAIANPIVSQKPPRDWRKEIFPVGF